MLLLPVLSCPGPPTERALFAFDGRLDTKWLATADFLTGIEFELAPKLLYTVCPSVEYDEYEKCNSPPETALVVSPAFSASRYGNFDIIFGPNLAHF